MKHSSSASYLPREKWREDGVLSGGKQDSWAAMLLSEQDENYFRQRCLDMGFDLGFDVFCQGGQALVRWDQIGAKPAVVARPTNALFFWEETWYALRRSYSPKPPARVVRPRKI